MADNETPKTTDTPNTVIDEKPEPITDPADTSGDYNPFDLSSEDVPEPDAPKADDMPAPSAPVEPPKDEPQNDEPAKADDPQQDEHPASSGNAADSPSSGAADSGTDTPPSPAPAEDEADWDRVNPEDALKDKAVISKIAEAAQKEVAEQFGEEFDELNMKHRVAFDRASRQLSDDVVNHVRSQKQAALANRDRDRVLPTDEHKRFAKSRFQELPFREADKLLKAEQSGDFKPVMEFLQKCRSEFDGKKETKEKADKKAQEIKKNLGTSPTKPGPSPEAEPDDESGAAGPDLFGFHTRE